MRTFPTSRSLFALVLGSILACGGCATGKLPESQLNMADIYDGSSTVQAAQSEASRRTTLDGGDSLGLYTREAATEIATRFPRVPNPTLVMYVFPHLALDMPIPGYVTTFPTWESAPYALPGETVRATDVISP